MDIVTHAASGLVLAAPLAPHAPLTAACLVLGSVAPDLDAISRCFGKRAFLRCHQTFTHSIAVAVVAGGLVTAAVMASGLLEPWAGAAFAGGMMIHIAMDLSNTYGVAVAAPFIWRRWSFNWIFFIDAAVVIATVLALSATIAVFAAHDASYWVPGVAYGAFLLAYWAARALLHHRAKRLAPPDTLTLLPTALWPWRYLGYAHMPGSPRVDLFTLNALTGQSTHEDHQALFDDQYEQLLQTIPEFRLMRELSPAYHAVAAEPVDGGQHITCTDLRTRNFGGRFGTLELTVAASGEVTEKVFHV